MSDLINVALLGAGRIGKVHAESLARHIPGARLYAVADVSADAAQSCAAMYGARAETDYRRLLGDPEVHAVAICTATDTHAQIITEAAEAGKQIFCEKPIALGLDRIDAALAAVARAGVKLQIGFNRRFDSSFRRARAAALGGEVGAIERVHITSRDPAPPPISYIKVSGGLFLDMMIHDFDMVRYLTGQEAVEVFAMAGSLVDPAIGAAGDVDTAVVMLRLESGAIASIENSRRAVYGYDQRAEVFGSGGVVRTENHYPNSATLSDARGVRRDLPYNFFMDRYTESFRAELSEFIGAVRSGAPVPVTGQDGRAPVVMAMAAARSRAEGRPVRIAEIG
jgi:myo-inositol 2-dehydrogenase / D-chiro-inositol 1-dehydrogenase